MADELYGQCPHCLGTLTAAHVCPEFLGDHTAKPTLQEANGQQDPSDTMWNSAETLMRVATHPDYLDDAHHTEHMGAGKDFRILVERSANGGRRVVIADDKWMRQHGGYFPEAC